ncbi:MAG TPA: GYD domain-containing protein [Anaeromyxobacteraceae bacterium]|nr:GYD domain-containing protein [Anaeromyxobacteraceae bacterium]
MAKYLVQFTYTDEGMKGLIREGGSKRREALEQAVKSVGGKIEAFYFAFGESDGIAIVEGASPAPDPGLISVLLAISASGAVRLKTTILITPEDMDQSVKKSPSYRPPGK